MLSEYEDLKLIDGRLAVVRNDYLQDNRHKDANIQHEYDKRFGLVLT